MFRWTARACPCGWDLHCRLSGWDSACPAGTECIGVPPFGPLLAMSLSVNGLCSPMAALLGSPPFAYPLGNPASCSRPQRKTGLARVLASPLKCRRRAVEHRQTRDLFRRKLTRGQAPPYAASLRYNIQRGRGLHGAWGQPPPAPCPAPGGDPKGDTPIHCVPAGQAGAKYLWDCASSKF